jgi:hypothetical protein
MGSDQEGAVKAFLAECEGTWDSTQVEDIHVGHMAVDATYKVHAWKPPLVGGNAIRAELLLQGQGSHRRPYRDFVDCVSRSKSLHGIGSTA